MESGANILDRFNQKVDELISKINAQHGEIEHLRNELTIAKAECEAKNNEISNLYEELSGKEREIEGALARMDEALSK